jgi:peroxin-6
MPQHPFPLTPQYFLAELATPEDTEVLVTQYDFELAMQDLVPSVSHSELQHYARIQRQFSHET